MSIKTIWRHQYMSHDSHLIIRFQKSEMFLRVWEVGVYLVR